MKKPTAIFQIGKQGLKEGFAGLLKTAFKSRENVKISVLKSGTRDKNELEEIGKKLVESLGKNYTYKTVGYTIFLKKWRKQMRE